MDRFIPYEKLSKKEQRERSKLKRGSWGAVNPVTRKPANPKAYNRQKARRWKLDPPERAFFFCPDSCAPPPEMGTMLRQIRKTVFCDIG